LEKLWFLTVIFLGLGVVQASRQSVESDNRNFTLQMWGRIGEIKSFVSLVLLVIFVRHCANLQIAKWARKHHLLVDSQYVKLEEYANTH
jgi:hypothetical protein